MTYQYIEYEKVKLTIHVTSHQKNQTIIFLNKK